jgi:hypothetical protein
MFHRSHSHQTSNWPAHCFCIAIFGAIPLLATAAGTAGAADREVLLYETDFSDFTSGDGNLVEQDGWTSTHPDEIVHGIVDDYFGDGNRSGTLGLFIPETDDKIITVYRPIAYDPIESGSPVIEFSASVAIIDSDETRFYDSFHISVFSSTDDLLGSVVFDNTEENLGIWRSDGIDFFDTGVVFEHSILYQLRIRIDYAGNTWTATLDDTALFTDAPFTKAKAQRDLGDFSVEWEISDIANPGDNWILFDDWTVVARSISDPDNVPAQPFAATRLSRRPNGNIVLRWQAEPNRQYQVEDSPNLTDWNTSLPDSLITTGNNDVTATFIDQTSRRAKLRYYRVREL